MLTPRFVWIAATLLAIFVGVFGQVSQKSAETATETVVEGVTQTPTSAGSPLPTSTQPCNGHASFCTRSYGNITYVGTHNSPFVKEGSVSANQDLDVTQQLTDGVRMLQGQVHMLNGVLHYCHTSCDLLDSGTVEAYLGKVADWLHQNPYEVISILFANADSVDVETFVAPLENSGIADLAFTPPTTSTPLTYNQWPTLGNLIETGKRVVLYMDYKADQSRVPYILDEFTYMWETKFSPTDPNFPCTVDRPPNQATSGDKLYMANHNLNVEFQILGEQVLIPDKGNLTRTNAASGFGSLGLAAEQCVALWGRPPTFLLVDFYQVGDGSVFEVAAKMNDVDYLKNCCSVSPQTTGAPGSGSKSRLKGSLLVFSGVISLFSKLF